MKLEGTSLFGTIALTSVLVLSGFSLILPQASAQTTLTLGDFYCWDISEAGVGIVPNSIILQDQFRVYNDLTTFNAFQFCDAADKDLPDAQGNFGDLNFLTPFDAQHFTTYTIPPIFDPPNQVDLSISQFGLFYNNLDVGVVKEVWVPDTKKRENLDPELPENDQFHYVCYEITEDPLNRDIQMVTQFGITEVTVLDPFLLCNPALKIHNGEPFNDQTPAWFEQLEHLTCFNIILKSDPVPPVPDLDWVSDQLIVEFQPNIPIDFDPPDHKICVESNKADEGVAGSLVPINYSMLILAGAQMIGAWIIPAIVASAGFAIVIARKY